MKKIALAVILYFAFNAAMGWSSKYSDISPGARTDIEVKGNGGVIALRLQVETTQADLSPSVEVVQEVNGFDCQIQKVSLINDSYDSFTSLHSQQHEILVQWHPGADHSACAVKVEFPGQAAAKAYLYMNSGNE